MAVLHLNITSYSMDYGDVGVRMLSVYLQVCIGYRSEIIINCLNLAWSYFFGLSIAYGKPPLTMQSSALYLFSILLSFCSKTLVNMALIYIGELNY